MGERYFGGNAVDANIEEAAEAKPQKQCHNSEVDLYKCHGGKDTGFGTEDARYGEGDLLNHGIHGLHGLVLIRETFSVCSVYSVV